MVEVFFPSMARRPIIPNACTDGSWRASGRPWACGTKLREVRRQAGRQTAASWQSNRTHRRWASSFAIHCDAASLFLRQGLTSGGLIEGTQQAPPNQDPREETRLALSLVNLKQIICWSLGDVSNYPWVHWRTPRGPRRICMVICPPVSRDTFALPYQDVPLALFPDGAAPRLPHKIGTVPGYTRAWN